MINEFPNDRLEIADLVSRLGSWLDRRDGDPASLYDQDVVVRSPGGEFTGFDAVIAYLTRDDAADEHAQHFHTDLIIELDGDRARVRGNQLVQVFRTGQPPHRTAGLRLDYRLVRRTEGWRLATIDIELAWVIGALAGA